jgi:type II secretory pathway pseudopilin PulG
MARRTAGEAGVTLVELMVSAALVGIAVGLIFSIFAASSSAFRGQVRVAETTQSLSAASEILERDLRMTGYTLLNTTIPGDATAGGVWPGGGRVITAGSTVYSFLNPLAVINRNDGPDQIRIVYASPGCEMYMAAPFTSPISDHLSFMTEDASCMWGATDLVTFWRPVSGDTRRGNGCISRVIGTGSDPNFMLASTDASDPLSGRSVGWLHCHHVPQPAGEVTPLMQTSARPMANRVVMRAYRIKDGDARGVLQLSRTGGLVADWEDVAFGFIDLQVALRVWRRGDTIDEDGDGDAELDWLSSENMESPELFDFDEVDGVVGTVRVVRVTLVAKSAQDSNGVVATTTPDLTEAENEDHNPVGDHPSESLADITDKTSPLYGEYVIRLNTVRVELRNHGIGK